MSLNVKTIDEITSTATDISGTTYIPIRQDGTTKKLPASYFLGYSYSGTYTPTLTNTTNVATSASYTCSYSVTDDYVSVSGVVDVTLTASSTASALGMSLPVASNFLTERYAGGNAYSKTVAAGWAISADATNDRVTFSNSAIATTNSIRYGFSFGYFIA